MSTEQRTKMAIGAAVLASGPQSFDKRVTSAATFLWQRAQSEVDVLSVVYRAIMEFSSPTLIGWDAFLKDVVWKGFIVKPHWRYQGTLPNSLILEMPNCPERPDYLLPMRIEIPVPPYLDVESVPGVIPNKSELEVMDDLYRMGLEVKQ
jgi:hypothetical protein